MRVAVLGSLFVATVVSAANIAVQVGPNSGLTYSPNSVTAAVGDVITFTFEAKNHTVTQSSFTDPCVKAANAINSGFMPVTAGATLPTFQFTVNVTTPLWFYCAQTNPASHCKAGMVFAVNPTATNTFAKFQSNAENGGSSSSGSSSSGSSSGATGSSGSGSAPSGTASSGGASGSASGGAATGSGSSNTAAASPSSTGNAAVMINSNFGGLLTVVGLIAGLSL